MKKLVFPLSSDSKLLSLSVANSSLSFSLNTLSFKICVTRRSLRCPKPSGPHLSLSPSFYLPLRPETLVQVAIVVVRPHVLAFAPSAASVRLPQFHSLPKTLTLLTRLTLFLIPNLFGLFCIVFYIFVLCTAPVTPLQAYQRKR